MVDSLRSGGFTSPSLGFGSRSSGFSQYRIGDAGEDLAYLDKLAAETAWRNGLLDDDSYLAALEKYVNATDPESSSRISAENQLEDARWSIGRNDRVLAVNRATTPQATRAALARLIAYDRSRLATMQPGNEAYRTLQTQIQSLQADVRVTTWDEYVLKYNAGKLSAAKMRQVAVQLARQSAGQPDQADWKEKARSFSEQIANDELQDAIQEWQDKPTAASASRVNSLYSQRMAGLSKNSPQYEDFQEAQQAFNKAVEDDRSAKEYAVNQSRHESGAMSDDEWLDYMRRRVAEFPVGSVERVRARDAYISEQFNSAERTLSAGVADGSRDPAELASFYESALASMNLDSARAMQLREQIANLRAIGTEAISLGIGSSSGGYGGHFVYPTGPYPGGPPPNRGGYISQHDGSAFASTNCGMAASAMLAWDVTGGKTRVTGGELRYYSGDREAGTWTDDMVRALDHVGVGARQFSGMALATFRKRVSGGKPAVLTGDTRMLPTSLQHGYPGGHSIFVADAKNVSGNNWYFVMDPNGRAGYKGEWWPESAIAAFAWSPGTDFYGDAVFAGRSGDAKRTVGSPYPPHQAFDTDWEGRSTLGRGGGASREEAGPAQDWSKGRPSAAAGAQKGVDDATVTSFLAAVTELESSAKDGLPDVELPPDELGARERRAREVLAANGGDPRAAAVEWFTGKRPEGDVSTWGKTGLFYANAVGGRMGWDKLDRDDLLKPLTPDEAVATNPLGGLPKDDTFETGLPDELDGMAKGLLRQLGVPATETNVRSVAAWVVAESGGKVEGNNPLGLITAGTADLPGQSGKSESGAAIFSSLEDGLAAAAAEIRNSAPELVGALRSTDPEAFMLALEQAKWSESDLYGNSVAQAYNTLPGVTPIVTSVGSRPLTAPTAFSQLTRTTPELEDMLDVDPSDPVQMSWFKAQVESARDSMRYGRTTWAYSTPGGQVYNVPFSPEVARDILALNEDYIALDPGATYNQKKDAHDEYMASSSGMDYDRTKRFLEESQRQYDAALMMGDLATAINIRLDQRDAVGSFLGFGPYEDIDVEAARNPLLTDTQRAALTTWVEKVEPWSNDPMKQPAQGDPIMAMVADGSIDVTYQPSPPGLPGMAAVRPRPRIQTANAKGNLFFEATVGGLVPHTEDNDPEMFAPVTEITPQGNERRVPLYRSSESPFLHITDALGRDVYQRVEEYTPSNAIVYSRAWTGRSAAVVQQQQSPPPEGWYGTTSYAEAALSGSGQPTMTAQPDPEESLPYRAGVLNAKAKELGHPQLYRVQVPDPLTNTVITWVSYDKVNWVGWMGNNYEDRSPSIVPVNGAAYMPNPSGNDLDPPVLYVNGRPWSETEHGPASNYLAWYGSSPELHAPGDKRDSTGAPGEGYFFRSIRLGTDPRGDTGMSLDSTITPQERWKAGLVTHQEALGLPLVLGMKDSPTWRSEMVRQSEEFAFTSPVAPIRIGSPFANKVTFSVAPGGATMRAEAAGNAVMARAGATEIIARAQAEARAAKEAAAAEAAKRAAVQAQAATIGSRMPEPVRQNIADAHGGQVPTVAVKGQPTAPRVAPPTPRSGGSMLSIPQPKPALGGSTTTTIGSAPQTRTTYLGGGR